MDLNFVTEFIELHSQHGGTRNLPQSQVSQHTYCQDDIKERTWCDDGNIRQMLDLLKYLVILIVPLCIVVLSPRFPTFKLHLRPPTRPEQTPAEKDPKKKLKTVMEPRADLEEPRNEPFTKEQLGEFDGSDDEKPIYVAIKGCYLTMNVYLSTHFLFSRHYL